MHAVVLWVTLSVFRPIHAMFPLGGEGRRQTLVSSGHSSCVLLLLISVKRPRDGGPPLSPIHRQRHQDGEWLRTWSK